MTRRVMRRSHCLFGLFAVLAATFAILPAAGASAQELPPCCEGTACCGGPNGATPCELRYGASGTVTDARTGAPIVGAQVVINGAALPTFTDFDGHYGLFLSRADTCHLDYLVDVSITAEGYAPFRDTLYTSVPLRQVDARLQPTGSGTGVTVSGIVADTFPCDGGATGVTVTLEPLGLQQVVGSVPGSPTGYFEFRDIPPGAYTLRADPACNVHGCWEPLSVDVLTTDVTASLCPMLRRDAVQLGLGHPVGEPGGLAVLEVTISDAQSAGGDPTRINATLGFGSAAAIVAGTDGSPACLAGVARSATFTWSPDGCTPGTDCTAVVADLDTTSSGLADGAALFACTVAITDQPADTCFHTVECLDVDVRRADGRELASACLNGWVESRFAVPPLSYAFSITPERPEIGDPVRVEVTVNGAGGLPSFQLEGARPYFGGNTTITQGGPVAGTIGFDLVAEQQGVANLMLSVSYETQLGCPGITYFAFVRDASAPFPVEVQLGDATPVPTLTRVPSHFPGTPVPSATPTPTWAPPCPTGTPCMLGSAPVCDDPPLGPCPVCPCQPCPACPPGQVPANFTANACVCVAATPTTQPSPGGPEDPDANAGGGGGGSCAIDQGAPVGVWPLGLSLLLLIVRRRLWSAAR